MIRKLRVYSKEQVEKMSINELRNKFLQLQTIAKDGNQALETLNKMKERYKLSLFAIIRNNAVMPKGVELKKTRDEINKMSYETLCEVVTMVDYAKIKKEYNKGKELSEKEIK
jgi:hypothetical protein